MPAVAGAVVDLIPCEEMRVDARGAHIQHQRVGGALLGADRPAPFKGGELGVSPCTDLLPLRPFDADGWIMLQPTLADRVLDQDAKLLQRVERGPGSVRYRIKDEAVDAILSETSHGAIPVVHPDLLEARGIAVLARVAQCLVLAARFVGRDQGADRAGRILLDGGPRCLAGHGGSVGSVGCSQASNRPAVHRAAIDPAPARKSTSTLLLSQRRVAPNWCIFAC